MGTGYVMAFYRVEVFGVKDIGDFRVEAGLTITKGDGLGNSPTVQFVGRETPVVLNNGGSDELDASCLVTAVLMATPSDVAGVDEDLDFVLYGSGEEAEMVAFDVTLPEGCKLCEDAEGEALVAMDHFGTYLATDEDRRHFVIVFPVADEEPPAVDYEDEEGRRFRLTFIDGDQDVTVENELLEEVQG